MKAALRSTLRIATLFLVVGATGCGGGDWSADDPVPGWMNDLESAIPTKAIDASSISGSGYDASSGTFTLGDATFTVTVSGSLPKSLPLRLQSGTSVDVTYTAADGGKFQLTLDGDTPSIRLPLRPGAGTLRLVGRAVSPTGVCTVRLSS